MNENNKHAALKTVNYILNFNEENDILLYY